MQHTFGYSYLSSFGLAVKNEGGLMNAEISDNISSGDRALASSALVTYHLQMMELAKESLDRFTADQRDISNACVPLSKENFEKIRGMIQAVRARLYACQRTTRKHKWSHKLIFNFFLSQLKKEVSYENLLGSYSVGVFICWWRM